MAFGFWGFPSLGCFYLCGVWWLTVTIQISLTLFWGVVLAWEIRRILTNNKNLGKNNKRERCLNIQLYKSGQPFLPTL